MRAPSRGSWLLIAGAWIAVVAATQAWLSWSTGITQLFASDVVSYERIARAAPGLPSVAMAQQHAERFPVHWLIGTLADATGAELHLVYRIVSVAVLGAVVVVVSLMLRRLRLEPGAYTIAIGLLVASVYPMRYLLAAPGMVADAVFLLGFAIALFGLVAGSDAAIVGGLLLATAGRQTALPVAIVFGVVLAARGRWRPAVAAVVLPVALYLVLRIVADPFASGGVIGGVHSVAAAAGRPRELADHLGRVALPLLVPAAVIAGACVRARQWPPLVPLALAAAVIVQPLVLAPATVANNEPRLAGLAMPALVLAAACVLRNAELRLAEVAAITAAILVASMHGRYSDAGVGHATWAALEVTAAVAILAVLARRRDPVPAAASERVV